MLPGNESFDVRAAGSRARDHRATVGVAHQDDRPFLRVHNSLHYRDVVGERSERDLDGGDEITVSLENRNDPVPAASVGEGAVD
jgi:hypothetical protein